MKDVLFIKKEENSHLTTKEVVKIFKSTDDLNEIRSAVEQANDRLYVSWASVDWRDKQGEKIPIDDLIKQQDILLERNGPITDGHTNRVIGQTLAYKVLQHPRTQTLGVLHLNKVFNHSALDDEVWKETQEGKRKGSSVGGFREGQHMEIDKQTGMAMKVLDGFNQYETANVYSPANMFALNEAVSMVAKSAPDYEDAISEGTMIEMEHKATYDFIMETVASTGYMPSLEEVARHIAQDHISELGPGYYPALKEMEGNLKVSKKSDTAPIISTEKTIERDEPMDEVLKSEIRDFMKSEFETLIKSVNVAKNEDKDADDKEKDKEKVPEKEDAKKAEPAKEDPKDVNQKDTYKEEDKRPNDANEKDVFKKDIADLKQSVSELTHIVKSVVTPRPTTQVAKSEGNVALDIAMGKKRMTWEEINAMNR